MNYELQQPENPYKRRPEIVDFATKYATNIIDSTILSQEVNSVMESPVDDTVIATQVIDEINAHRSQITDENMKSIETDAGTIGLDDYRKKVLSAYQDSPLNETDNFNIAA